MCVIGHNHCATSTRTGMLFQPCRPWRKALLFQDRMIEPSMLSRYVPQSMLSRYVPQKYATTLRPVPCCRNSSMPSRYFIWTPSSVRYIALFYETTLSSVETSDYKKTIRLFLHQEPEPPFASTSQRATNKQAIAPPKETFPQRVAPFAPKPTTSPRPPNHRHCRL